MKIKVLAGVLFCCWAAQAVYAQSSINITISNPPGAGSDGMGRAFAEELRQRENTVVVVENKAGANGTIAAQAVAREPADGRHFLISTDPIATVNPFLYTKSQFNINDLEPIAVLTFQPAVLAVRVESPYQTVADLIKAGEEREITYSSAGIGSPGHMMMAFLNQLKPLKVVHVPYRGGAPATMGLLSGEVETAFLAVGNIITHIDQGKLRALAVSSPERIDLLPDVPTMVESGFPDFAVRNANLLFAPKGLSDEARQNIYQHVTAIRQAPAFLSTLQKFGMTPSDVAPDKTVHWLSTEGRRWEHVIKKSGLKVD